MYCRDDPKPKPHIQVPLNFMGNDKEVCNPIPDLNVANILYAQLADPKSQLKIAW